MILFDTTYFGEYRLQKFEGRKCDLVPSQGTYKSFNKAKYIVIKNLKAQIKELEKELMEVESISSPENMEFTENPFTGYLREKHGELD